MKAKKPSLRPAPVTTPRSDWFSIANPAERRALLWIIGIGLLLRLIYIVQLKGSILWGNYVLDAQALDLWAKQIADGQLVSTQPFFRAPLYAYLIGLIYAVFGTTPLPVILFQTLLGVGSIYLTFIYARRLFDTKVAIVAAAFTAAWPTLIYYEGELSITTLEVAVGLAALIFIHRAVDRRTRSSLLAAGLALGLAAITRPTFLLILPLLPLGLWRLPAGEVRTTIGRAVATFTVALILPLVPVTLHNLVFGHDFVLIASQGGSNFYLGNSATADGITAQQIGVAQYDAVMQDNIASIAVAERELGRKLKDSEASSYWMNRAFSDIFADPARAVMLLVKKLYLFWHGQEIFNNKSLYYAGEYSWFMRAFLWKAGLNFPSGLLFPLMLAGIFIAYRDRRALLVPTGYLLLYTIAIALFFVCARFRQPIVPVAVIFAVAAILSSLRMIAVKSWRAIAVPAAIFVVALLALNWGGDVESRENQSQFETILGGLYHRSGDRPAAAAHYERAVALVPKNIRVYAQLGRAYTEGGQLDRAVAAFQRGIALAPDYPALRYNFGIALTRFGRLEDAKASFRAALQLAPNAVDARLALAEVYEFQKQPDSALMLYQEILSLAPQHPVATQKVAQLRSDPVAP